MSKQIHGLSTCGKNWTFFSPIPARLKLAAASQIGRLFRTEPTVAFFGGTLDIRLGNGTVIRTQFAPTR